MRHRHRHRNITDTSAQDDAGGSRPRLWRTSLTIVVLLCIVGVAPAKKRPQGYGLSGLGVSVDAGLFVPSDRQAFFYDGRDERPNTINRLLRSQSYGDQIWTAIQNSNTPMSGVDGYSQIVIAEYPTMDFRLTYQIGMGIRYDYESGWAWLARMGYSQLTATGQFLIPRTTASSTLTNQRQYVVGDIVGREKRIYIDLGIARRVRLSDRMVGEVSGGMNINNVKVQSHDIRVGGQTWSILDVWGSSVVETGMVGYDYINQGMLGIGLFASAALSYPVGDRGTVDIGYTFYRTQTRYREIDKKESMGLQHVAFVRMNINNFRF